MGTSTLSGPIRAGTVRTGDTNDNTGWVVMSKTGTFSSTDTSQSNVTLKVPSGSVIMDIIYDVTVAFNGTSTAITAGSALAGAQYGVSTLMTSAGRIRPTYSAANLTAMASTAADTGSASSSLYFTSTPGAGNNTGTVIVTITYAQRANTLNSN